MKILINVGPTLNNAIGYEENNNINFHVAYSSIRSSLTHASTSHIISKLKSSIQNKNICHFSQSQTMIRLKPKECSKAHKKLIRNQWKERRLQISRLLFTNFGGPQEVSP